MVAGMVTLRRRRVLRPEASMHQASILFTAAVMAMAGAWYVLQDNARTTTETAVGEKPAMIVAQADPAAEPLE